MADTCSSPFTYSDIIEGYSTQTVSYAGSYTINAYTLPSISLCSLCWSCTSSSTWRESYPCHKHKCGHHNLWTCWDTCTDTWTHCDSSKLVWCDCWSGNIELWPTIDITASMNVPMTFGCGTGFTVGTTGETGIETSSISVSSFSISMGINGDNLTINVDLGEGITLQQDNGTFSATLYLTSLSSSYTDSTIGVTYSISIVVNLLMCAEPIPPISWLNIQLVTRIEARFDADGVDTADTIDFTVNCPITDS